MRWNEANMPEDDKSKPEEREVPLSQPGEDNEEALLRSKKLPMKGRNPYA